MCGFTGFTNTTKHKEDVLEKMKEQIVHRGPDAEGSYLDDDVALGFRRLSIIDLDHGQQPMKNEDESLVLIFNGEIYNYKQLRKELIEAGHVFQNESDSEVLLHGYEEFGKELPKRLRGMFAFVIWDKEKKKLFGARDYFGIKPFYYAQMEDSFLFGSEIKSFLPHPSFHKELNKKALEQYLSFQYSAYAETFFKGVFKLLPAHQFEYQNGKLDIERYWSVEFEENKEPELEDWTDEIEAGFADSVSCHKISDVEVGSFLSGGIDSGYLVTEALVDKTFTVGFSSARYNEMDRAKKLSGDLGIKNISKLIDPEEYWDIFPHVQYHMDEPLADPSAVALYFVCQTASKHVKVALSGEGADELFGGYNIYKEPLDSSAYTKLPAFIRKAVSFLLRGLPPVRGINYLVRKGTDLEKRFIGNAYIFTEKERKKLLKFSEGAESPADFCAPFYEKVKDKDSVTKMQYLDLHMWLQGDILLKADKMSMANSLEVRVPYLDKPLMDTARKIPLKYRVNGEDTKYALRKAALKKLPADYAWKEKLGFPIPIREWIKEDGYFAEVESKFRSEAAAQFFHTEEICKLLHDHRKGKRDNSRKVWTIYTFLVWYAQYFENSVSEHAQQA